MPIEQWESKIDDIAALYKILEEKGHIAEGAVSENVNWDEIKGYIRDARTAAYQEGFIDGGNASGEQAQEIHAIELVEVQKFLLETILEEDIWFNNEHEESEERDGYNSAVRTMQSRLEARLQALTSNT